MTAIVGSQGGKLLTMSFEGYEITIAERLLSHWPQLDAMCTVYDYSHESRLVGGPLIPSLPVDALTIAGKMTKSLHARPILRPCGSIPLKSSSNKGNKKIKKNI